MNIAMAWLWMAPAVTALALPFVWRESPSQSAAAVHLRSRNDRTVLNPDTGAILIVGETAPARTIYSLVSSICLFVLALLLGYRARQLKYNAIRKAKFTSILVVLLYFFAIMFIITASVVQTGLGLSTHVICYSAAIICLVFYTGNKLTIYIFLLERARVVRAPFVPRYKDWLWVIGMLIIIGGFGTIAIIGYMSPIVDLSRLDGRCRIGLPPKVSFPLLSFDVGVNLLLTGVFFFLLRPILSSNGNSSFTFSVKGLLRRKARITEDDHSVRGNHLRAINRNIKTLLWKSLIGSTLVMLPTVGNMAQFYIMKGRELGWICLTICTFDVSWGVIVVHWLTMGSEKTEENLTKSVKTLQELDAATSTSQLATFERTPCRREDSHITPAQTPGNPLKESEKHNELKRSAEATGQSTANVRSEE